MTTYHVSRWSDLYENNRSRSVRTLEWVPIPNKHDGEKYSRLIARKDGAQIFAAWILILQVASRCQPRGSLVRVDGSPYDSEALSIKTRAPQAWFELALGYLAEIGWLDKEVIEQSEFALACQATDSQPTVHRQTTALKGREGNEGKGSTGLRPTVSEKPTLDLWIEYGKRFEPGWPKSDAEGAFDHYQANGWTQGRGKKIKDWQAALRTCVKNWKDRGGRPFGAPILATQAPRPSIYDEPEGWREKALLKWPGSTIPDHWLDLSSTLRNDLLA